MKNNSSINKWYRLEQKNLDNQFTNRLIIGLSCSPFEAKCIVNAMYETYQPFFNNVNTLIPGQTIFQAISIKTPPSVPLSKAAYVSVILTIDAGKEDLKVRILSPKANETVEKTFTVSGIAGEKVELVDEFVSAIVYRL